MRRIRKLLHPVLFVIVPLLACAGPGGDRHVDAGGALDRGSERVSDLISLSRRSDVVVGGEALELLYLERARLGLGSPFRLIEQALVDERLEPARRRALGEALLAMTVRGAGYEIDPGAVAGPRVRVEPGLGPGHLGLLADAVAEASDPRVGEQAVRLAYLLAQAEALVDPVLVRGVAQAAALVRDREIARDDARALVREAHASARDPLDLVREWRAARRFTVEAPRIEGLDASGERLAIELAPRLLSAIREVVAGQGERFHRLRPEQPPLLNAATALSLAGRLEAAPPQAPVAVAVGLAGRMFAGSYGVEPDSLAAQLRRRMPNEEALALQGAVLFENQPELKPVLSRAMLAAASGLRAYGQEVVWRPGMEAPSTRELIAQFGLADIRFAEDLPASWRPYYRRQIHSALLDLQRVLPALDVTGLTLSIGPVPTSGALALHSPAQRVVHLPPETGAGTIAHEIAHDIDWQVARRRYRVRGDYGSDIAARGGRNDRLAATYVGLTGHALLDNAGTTIDRPHHSRPAEIFARSIDWLVAASLARDGRMNGYLTSIQDEVLTGYGTAVPPDMNGRVGAALVNILDEVAPLRAETRAWYLEAYGIGRGLSSTDLIRAIAELPADSEGSPNRSRPLMSAGPGTAEAALREPLSRLRTSAAEAIAIGVCRAPANSLEPGTANARLRLIEAAARARARGIARDYAARAMGRRGVTALDERFEPGPWSTRVEPAEAELLRGLVEQAKAAMPSREIPTGGWFDPIVAPECG